MKKTILLVSFTGFMLLSSSLYALSTPPTANQQCYNNIRSAVTQAGGFNAGNYWFNGINDEKVYDYNLQGLYNFPVAYIVKNQVKCVAPVTLKQISDPHTFVLTACMWPINNLSQASIDCDCDTYKAYPAADGLGCKLSHH